MMITNANWSCKSNCKTFSALAVKCNAFTDVYSTYSADLDSCLRKAAWKLLTEGQCSYCRVIDIFRYRDSIHAYIIYAWFDQDKRFLSGRTRQYPYKRIWRVWTCHGFFYFFPSGEPWNKWEPLWRLGSSNSRGRQAHQRCKVLRGFLLYFCCNQSRRVNTPKLQLRFGYSGVATFGFQHGNQSQGTWNISTSWNAGLWNILKWQFAKRWNADLVAAAADGAPIQIWVDTSLARHNKMTVSYPINKAVADTEQVVQKSGSVQGGQGAARSYSYELLLYQVKTMKWSDIIRYYIVFGIWALQSREAMRTALQRGQTPTVSQLWCLRYTWLLNWDVGRCRMMRGGMLGVLMHWSHISHIRVLLILVQAPSTCHASEDLFCIS